GFILYRRNERTQAWISEWIVRSERNFTFAGQTPLPFVDALAGIEDEAIRRKLLCMDQTSLVEILNPQANSYGLAVKALHYSWNYADSRLPENNSEPVRVLHSTRL